MPDLVGKDCKTAQAEVDALFDRFDTKQDDEMHSFDICSYEVVQRTSPTAGTVLATGGTVLVTYWSMDRSAYRWFTKHPTMPDVVGKKYVYGKLFGGAEDEYVNEKTDYSKVTDGYAPGDTIITSTRPAAGEPLALGQHMVVRDQVRNGERYDDSGGGGGSVDLPHLHSPIHVHACVGGRILHVCT